MSYFKNTCICILLYLAAFFSLPCTAKEPPFKAAIDTLNSKGYKLIRNNAAKALIMFVEAEQQATKYHYNEGLAAAYVNQAEVFNQRGYLKRSLVLYYQAMSISAREDDDYHFAQCEQHISTVKRHMGQYDDAGRLLKHALGVFTRLRKPIDIVNVELRLGLLNVSEKHYAEALKFYNDAYRLCIKSKYQYGEKKSYYNRGLMYEDLHKPDSALNYFNKALHIDTVTHDLYGKALSYIEVGRTYLTLHSLTSAERYAENAFTNADSVTANDLTTSAAGLLVDVYKEKHDLINAVAWQDKLLAVNKKVSDQEKRDAVSFIDVLKAQQESENSYLNQLNQVKKESMEKNLLILGFLIILIIVIMLGLAVNSNYRKAKTFADALRIINQQVQEKSTAVESLNYQILNQNASLEQDNTLKNKLLSVISHDLRHPLVNTQSLLQLYNQDILSETESKSLFSKLETQYVRTITLLDNLLFWIKRQVQHEDAIKTSNVVRQLISELIEEQKIGINNKRITVNNEVDEALCWCNDREAMRIVFRNLLNNALKFTPDHGTICFSSAENRETTSVTVSDNGMGMGKSKLQKVIEGSYMSTSGTSGEMGSGFGLILVRDLISKSGGRLEIQSNLNEGSSFTITFDKSAV